MGARGLILILLVGCLASAATACTSAACREENLPEYKDRATPLRTVLLFQYAIRHECYDLAYDCLDKESQEEVGRLKFKLFFCTVDYPGSDVSICDMIRDVTDLREKIKGSQATVDGVVEEIVINDEPTMLIVVAKLVEEGGRWTILGKETIRANGL